MEETTQTPEKEKKLKAKSTSLIGQIFATLWIAGWSTYKFIKTGQIEVNDVILSGLAITACFTPVYFSILMDKIKAVKWGDTQ